MTRLIEIHRALVAVVALWLACSCSDSDSGNATTPGGGGQAGGAESRAGSPAITGTASGGQTGGEGADAEAGPPATAGDSGGLTGGAGGADAEARSPGADGSGGQAPADAGAPAVLRPRPPSPNAPPVIVTGPITTGMGRPFSRIPETSLDLDEYDYVEEEFFFEGSASDYSLQGEYTTDGKWTAVPSSEADYKTRLLVRRPQNSTQFNGTVVVEWLNVTSGADADVGYYYTQAEILREGYAWVGVSAQVAGIEGGGVLGALVPERPSLKTYDAERYGSLQHPGDTYSFDVFTQAGQVIRDPGDVDVLGGLEPKRLIAYGESQSAFRLVTYVNAVHPLAKSYDGFFIHSRNVSGVPLQDSLFGPAPTVAQIRTDLEQPVLQFLTESEVFGPLASAAARQPDHDRLRTWEVAGSAHIDGFALGFSDTACENVNDGPQHFVLKAALHALNAWIADGSAPAQGEPITLDDNLRPILDEHENVRGGIRTPDVDVPIATHSGINGSADITCFLFGQTTPFTPAKLKELYPTHEDYVAKVTEAARAARDSGFLLAPEERALIDEAQAAPIPE